MRKVIKNIQIWFMRHPRLQQWLWFIALWLTGLLAVWAIAYPLKWLVKHM